jgi:fucose permease
MLILFGVGFIRTVFNISINTRSVEIQKLYEKPIVSLFHGLWSLACLVAAGIGTIMIIWHISPAIHFLGIALVCIAITLLLKKNPKPSKETESNKRPFFVKPDRYLLLLGLIAFCIMLCESTVFDWSVNYYEKVVKTDKGSTTFGYTAFIIMMSAGRLFGDRLIRLFGTTKLLQINSILLVTGFLIVACFPNVWAATLGFLLIGLGDSVIVPITYNLSAQTHKMPPSYALSAVTLIGYVGFLVGPILVGYISDVLNMQWAMALVGITCTAIFFLTSLVRKELTSMEKKRQQQVSHINSY